MTGSILYKMFDCGKCGVSFPMDRKEVLNSFYKPGKPKCRDCQSSPKEKGKRSKFNFISETSQAKEKMGKGIKTNQIKSKSLSSLSLSQTKSRIQCEECGKQFPMGGEWKYKKHMEVHMKGKQQVTANVDVKKAVKIVAERKE